VNLVIGETYYGRLTSLSLLKHTKANYLELSLMQDTAAIFARCGQFIRRNDIGFGPAIRIGPSDCGPNWRRPDKQFNWSHSYLLFEIVREHKRTQSGEIKSKGVRGNQKKSKKSE
jgi:hypothetical protein